MSDTHPAVRLSTGSGGLEWPEVLALLAREARTPMGREEAQAATPLADPDAIRRGLGETTQARAALGQTGVPPWEGVVDVRPMLEAARVPGSVAEAADMAALIPLLEAAGRLRAYGRAIAPVAPDLAAALAGFPPQKDLADLLARSIDADGQLRDDASPALRRVRGRIRDLRREIVKRLEAYFGAPGAEATFQERYVTVRHGRYVLPIRAEAKSRLRGIVHDRSQSGATLFVEPEGMVEANNDLVQAAREEEIEIVRILAALTDAVREALPDLDALVAGIGGLDLIFARGALAERMEAVEPAIDDARDVFLPAARNPLLLAQSWRESTTAGRGAAEGELSGSGTLIPMDIEIHAERPLLVITGPNAGGKTVALKTLGLLALMAQAGCHVPAGARARLPVSPRSSPSWATTRAWRRTSRPSPRSSSSSATCWSGWTTARSCCSTSWARAPIPTTGRPWPRPSSRRSPSAARWSRPRRISSRSRASPPPTRGPATPRSSSTPSGSRPPSGSSTTGPARATPCRSARGSACRPRSSSAPTPTARPSSGSSRSCSPASTTATGGTPSAPPRSTAARRRARGCWPGPRRSWRRRAPPRARRWPGPAPRRSGSSPRCGGT